MLALWFWDYTVSHMRMACIMVICDTKLRSWRTADRAGSLDPAVAGQAGPAHYAPSRSRWPGSAPHVVCLFG